MLQAGEERLIGIQYQTNLDKIVLKKVVL